tara:strand:- start:822 stop:1532 length:711 start_codon:yes stop_codon:yes gene_type:complete
VKILINKIKPLGLWIFLIPLISVNLCLILITNYHNLFLGDLYTLGKIFPYLDGQASISRVVRVYPNNFIFKPAMFITAFLLIKYWLLNRDLIYLIDKQNKFTKKFVFFGIASAIALVIHSIFLGIKFEYDLYKLFRRIVMLLFIIFEIIAQAYLVRTYYLFRNQLKDRINLNILKIKIILISILIIVAFFSIPIISLPGNDFFGLNLKFFKHALEWNYFMGVIFFYFLTFLMWKKN